MRSALRSATGLMSRAEVSAALANAVRLDWIERRAAQAALAEFHEEWPRLFRLPIRETTVGRADDLAWTHGLRGYDAVHLACAMLWQESVGHPVTLATFDESLCQAAAQAGLRAWPEQL
jgi:predicted nucleic acid-binding protein